MEPIRSDSGESIRITGHVHVDRLPIPPNLAGWRVHVSEHDINTSMLKLVSSASGTEISSISIRPDWVAPILEAFHERYDTAAPPPPPSTNSTRDPVAPVVRTDQDQPEPIPRSNW